MVKLYELKCKRCGEELLGTRRDKGFCCRNCGYIKFFQEERLSNITNVDLLDNIVKGFLDPGSEIEYFFLKEKKKEEFYLPFWYFLLRITFFNDIFFSKFNGVWSIFYPAFKYDGFLYFGNPGEKFVSFEERKDFLRLKEPLIGIVSTPFFSYLKGVFMFIKFIDRKRDITDINFKIEHLSSKIVGVPFKKDGIYLKSSSLNVDEHGNLLSMEVKFPHFSVDNLDDIIDFFES